MSEVVHSLPVNLVNSEIINDVKFHLMAFKICRYLSLSTLKAELIYII